MSAGPRERPDPRASARTCVVSLPLVVRRVLRGARRALHGCSVSLVIARDRLLSGVVGCGVRPFAGVNNQRTYAAIASPGYDAEQRRASWRCAGMDG